MGNGSRRDNQVMRSDPTSLLQKVRVDFRVAMCDLQVQFKDRASRFSSIAEPVATT